MKKKKFPRVPFEKDYVFLRENPKAGCYNYLKVLEKGEMVSTVVFYDNLRGRVSSEFQMYNWEIQARKDHFDQERWDKEQRIEEIARRLELDVRLPWNKGGSLSFTKTVSELKRTVKRLQEKAERYTVETTSIPTFGAGCNSMTMRSVVSGKAVSYSYNDVHHGGYYEGSHPFIVQIRVGGGLPSEVSAAIMLVAKKIVSMYHWETELGKTYPRESSGTSWSSWMLVAPYRGDSYNIVGELNKV